MKVACTQSEWTPYGSQEFSPDPSQTCCVRSQKSLRTFSKAGQAYRTEFYPEAHDLERTKRDNQTPAADPEPLLRYLEKIHPPRGAKVVVELGLCLRWGSRTLEAA